MKRLDEKNNKLTLIESCLGEGLQRLPLKEEESSAGSVGAWKCPIWRLGQLNLNGRVYTRDLAVRMMAENRVTPVCDGHDPDMQKEFKNYVAIAKEPWIEGDLFGCNVYIIDDEYQRKLERISALGFPIGVSSVGYGECDHDGVINAATYELVRYLDFVTYPAGEVYATKKESKQSNPESSAEHQENEAAALFNAKVEALRLYQQVLSMEEKIYDKE